MKWTPRDIRAELVRAGVSQAEIARALNRSTALVGQVIDGRTISDRVRRDLATRLGRSVEEIWPEYYLTRMAG